MLLQPKAAVANALWADTQCRSRHRMPRRGWLRVYGLTATAAATAAAAAAAAAAGTAAAAVVAPYGSEKAKINALFESLDGELRLTGNSGVTAQAMVIG